MLYDSVLYDSQLLSAILSTNISRWIIRFKYMKEYLFHISVVNITFQAFIPNTNNG